MWQRCDGHGDGHAHISCRVLCCCITTALGYCIGLLHWGHCIGSFVLSCAHAKDTQTNCARLAGYTTGLDDPGYRCRTQIFSLTHDTLDRQARVLTNRCAYVRLVCRRHHESSTAGADHRVRISSISQSPSVRTISTTIRFPNTVGSPLPWVRAWSRKTKTLALFAEHSSPQSIGA